MLGGRAFQRRVHSDEHVPRLVEKAEDRRVTRLLFFCPREREPGFEARVVNRGHEFLGEEGPHRLPDEVRRRNPGDPEPVGSFRCDRRLSGTGGAADEEQQGSSSRARASSRRSRRTVLAASSSPMTSAASSPRRSRSRERALLCSRSRSASRAIRYERSGSSPVTTSARAMSPLENGTSSPSGSGIVNRRSLMDRIWPLRGASRQGPRQARGKRGRSLRARPRRPSRVRPRRRRRRQRP